MDRLQKVLGHAGAVALALGAAAAALLGIWLCVFGTPLLASAALVSAALLLPLRRCRRARFAALGLGLAGSVAFASSFERDLGTRLLELARRKDAATLTFRDRLGLYGLNAVMGAGGWLAGFPEVAGETLALAWPGPPVRTWSSDFAMGSPRVRSALGKALAALPPSPEGTEVELATLRIAWPTYSRDEDSMRVALALNSPFFLGGRARRTGQGRGWVVDLTGTAVVAYPHRFFLPLGVLPDGQPWGLDEGLFWALQRAGWLHPYTAEWHWTIDGDDARLADPAHVERSLRERLFWELWRLLR
ncbi:MAG TPA: hypothetical protein VMB50_17205 [Myxococcales bacterium]|nr:hypothetical protein [Myxococcales bacterium]